MPKPVNKLKQMMTVRLVVLLLFALFYWAFHFILQKTSLQLSQVVFDLIAGVLAGAVFHVAFTKFLGTFVFGRGFCGWACWNAAIFDLLPVRRKRRRLPDKYCVLRYLMLALVLVVPFGFIFMGNYMQQRSSQFTWLLAENALIYAFGLWLAFTLGDRRAFCKYICPAGALMTFTSPRSIIKIEKNHLKCSKCGKCEEVCPMDVPILTYISANQRVSHPECILCTECVKNCPSNCLTVGIGRKSHARPEFGRSY